MTDPTIHPKSAYLSWRRSARLDDGSAADRADYFAARARSYREHLEARCKTLEAACEAAAAGEVELFLSTNNVGCDFPCGLCGQWFDLPLPWIAKVRLPDGTVADICDDCLDVLDGMFGAARDQLNRQAWQGSDDGDLAAEGEVPV